MAAVADDWYGLRRRHTGYRECPDLAVQSDHDLAVWGESMRRSWTINTVVLTTIRNRLRDDEPRERQPLSAR